MFSEKGFNMGLKKKNLFRFQQKWYEDLCLAKTKYWKWYNMTHTHVNHIATTSCTVIQKNELKVGLSMYFSPT